MVLEKILDKLKGEQKPEEPTEDWVEVEPSALTAEQKVDVRIESLKDFLDTNRIQELVRNGSVVFLKIKELRERDITELKRCVEKLRKTCVAMNGDIVGVDEDFLILTPQFARVFRG